MMLRLEHSQGARGCVIGDERAERARQYDCRLGDGSFAAPAMASASSAAAATQATQSSVRPQLNRRDVGNSTVTSWTR